MNMKWKLYLRPLLGTLLGSLISGAALNAFYRHGQLISGGFTGVAMLLNYQFGWNLSVTNLALTAPFLVLAWFVLGKRLFFINLAGTLIFSWAIGFTANVQVPYESSLTTVLLGGALYGLGMGIVVRSGGLTGGFDIIGRTIYKYFSVSMATSSLFFNLLVLSVFSFVKSLDLAVLTMAATMVASYVNNFVNDGLDRRRALYIITSEPEKIAGAILSELKRGVTELPCQGGYTHQDKTMLYVVITRFQLATIKRLIREADPAAFFSIHEVTGVYGQGKSFHSLKDMVN